MNTDQSLVYLDQSLTDTSRVVQNSLIKKLIPQNLEMKIQNFLHQYKEKYIKQNNSINSYEEQQTYQDNLVHKNTDIFCRLEEKSIKFRNIIKEQREHYNLVKQGYFTAKEENNYYENQVLILQEELKELNLRQNNSKNELIELRKPEREQLLTLIFKINNQIKILEENIQRQTKLNQDIQNAKCELSIENQEIEKQNHEIREQLIRDKQKPFLKDQLLKAFKDNENSIREKIQREMIFLKEEKKQFNEIVSKFERVKSFQKKEEQNKNKIKFKLDILIQEFQSKGKQLESKKLKQEDLIDNRKLLFIEDKQTRRELKRLQNVVFNISKGVGDKQREFKRLQNQIQTLKETNNKISLQKILYEKQRKNYQKEIQEQANSLLDIYNIQRKGVQDYDNFDQDQREVMMKKEKLVKKIQQFQKIEIDLQNKEQELRKELYIETNLREKIVRKLKHSEADYKSICEELAIKDLIQNDEKKKQQDLEQCNIKYKNMYQTVKQERNNYLSLIQTASQERSELREQFKNYQRQMQLLQNSNLEKENLLDSLCKKLQINKVQKEKLFKWIEKGHLDQNLKNQEMTRMSMILQDNKKTLDSLDKEIFSVEQGLSKKALQRDNLGKELILINEELVLLFEFQNVCIQKKRKINQYENSTVQYFKMISLQLKNAQFTQQHLVKRLQHLPILAQKYIDLQKVQQCYDKEFKEVTNLFLQKDQCGKMKLVGEDIYDVSGITKKLNLLNYQLNQKKENFLQNELVTDELDLMIKKFKNQATSERISNFTFLEESMKIKGKYQQIVRKLMSLISELSLLQAQKFHLQIEKQEISKNLEFVQENQKENKPPQKDSEIEFLKRIQKEMRYKEYITNKKQKENFDKYQRGYAVKTTAIQRPTAYINQIGLPKPFGKFRPYMTSYLPKIKAIRFNQLQIMKIMGSLSKQNIMKSFRRDAPFKKQNGPKDQIQLNHDGQYGNRLRNFQETLKKIKLIKAIEEGSLNKEIERYKKHLELYNKQQKMQNSRDLEKAQKYMAINKQLFQEKSQEMKKISSKVVVWQDKQILTDDPKQFWFNKTEKVEEKPFEDDDFNFDFDLEKDNQIQIFKQ